MCGSTVLKSYWSGFRLSRRFVDSTPSYPKQCTVYRLYRGGLKSAAKTVFATALPSLILVRGKQIAEQSRAHEHVAQQTS
jgi:hypothetical protein